MANNYYNFTGGPFTPGTKARSSEVNAEYNALVAAFDKLPVDDEAIIRGTPTFAGISTGSSNVYAVTMVNPRTSYQDGDEVVFIANHSNTGASTLNVDGLGPVNLVRADGNALTANDLVADIIYAVRYDETNVRFQLMGPTKNAITAAEAAYVSEVNAAASELAAYHWAQYAEDNLVPEGNMINEYSAYHWSKKAEAWAASVALPSISGNALKFLRANAGETGLEYYDVFGSTNTFTPLQKYAGGQQIYGDLAGVLYAGPGVEIEYITGADAGAIRSYDRNTATQKPLIVDSSLLDIYIGGTRRAYIHSTAFVHQGASGSSIIAAATLSNSPGVELHEDGGRRAMWYYDASANLTVWRQYLTDGSTVAAQLYMADTGQTYLTDVVNSKTLTAANGELIANGGDYFAREARPNTFTQAQYFNSGGMCLALKPGAADHCYMSFYPDTDSPNTRWAYLGFGGVASNVFFITTEQAGAAIAIQAAGTAGYITQQVNGVSMAYLDQYGLHSPNGMVRAQGSTAPTTGAGVELVHTGTSGYVQSYDRGTSTWHPLYLRGNPTYISVNGTLTTTFASTYVHTNVSSFILEAANPNVQLRDTATTNMDWLMRVVSGNWYLSKANDGGGAVTRNHIAVNNAAAYDLGVGITGSVYWLTYGNAVLGHWASSTAYSGVMTTHNSAAYLMMTAGTHNHISTPNAAGVIYLRPGVNDGTNQVVVSASDLTYRGTSVRSFGTRMNSAGTKVAGYGTTSRISIGRFRVTHNVGGSGVIATASVEGAGTGSTIELQVSYVSVNVFDVYARTTATGSLVDVALTCNYVAI